MKRMKMGWAIGLAMLLLPGLLWAQSGFFVSPNPSLEQQRVPYPCISISPGTYPHSARITQLTTAPSMMDYVFFYRGSHPHFVAAGADVWADTLRTTAVSVLEIVDSTSGIGDLSRNFCYYIRWVDAIVLEDTSTWTFTPPSEVVCEWDFPLVSTPGLTHWNQITIPVWDYGTDTIAGWADRIAGISEVDEWEPTTQIFQLMALKTGGIWTTGGNRRTKHLRPYHITGADLGDMFSICGFRSLDTCVDLLSNDALTDLNNVVIQPTWHWSQDDSSSNFRDFGMKLYDGTASIDYGVREILEWAPTTQSWQSRSLWNGTTWTSRPGVKVYGCYMLRRPYNTVPGGGTGTPCWPYLMR